MGQVTSTSQTSLKTAFRSSLPLLADAYTVSDVHPSVPPPTTTPRPTIDLGAACKVEWRDALDYARVMGTLYPPSCTLPCEYRVEYADLMGYWINDCAR